MNQTKKDEIIKRLKIKRSKYKGVMSFHLDDLIKDIDGHLQHEEVRDYVYNATGIKVRKVGKFLF